MSSSLEELVSNLSPEDFRIVGKCWQGEDFKLVTQKDIFPYEFMDSMDKLQSEGLPSKDKFYSTLRTCMESYELDPAHYVSAPGLSWDAFLKRSGKEIELVSDMDMFQFFERDIGDKKDCWDNSDYPKDSPYYSAYNKKVIGKFKDEAGGVPITEFVGLRCTLTLKKMVPLCPSVSITKSQQKVLKGKGNLKDFVYSIMGMLWSREVLSTHSITGKISNAIKEKDAKPQLDQEKVEGICGKLMTFFS
ncbi:Hypothetical predicted protein [Paramuricea clavata]|uniref:Uncharacterized protein n=1 Tax=Paramuricea clavata TaxID=317549 RepID=A0A7D9H915_PARCT|nr:Hypothetical predicted protein [Paramuricea clavata]